MSADVAPDLDWSVLMKVNTDDPASTSKGDLEEVYEHVSQAKVALDDDVTVDKMNTLFEASQQVMRMKHEALEKALKDVESSKSAGGDGDDKLQAEIERLTQQVEDDNALIEDLEQELENANKELDNFRADDHGDELGGESRTSLRRKLQEEESKYKALQRKLDKSEDRMVDTQKEIFVLKQAATKKDGTIRECEDRIADLEFQVQDLKQKVLEKADMLQAREEEELHARTAIQGKNKELLKYVKDIELLTEQLAEVASENEELKERFSGLENDLEAAQNEIQDRRVAMDDADRNIQELEREREKLKLKVTDLNMQIEAGGYSDEKLVSAVTQEIAEWKVVLETKNQEVAAKDREMQALYAEIQSMKEELSSATPARMKETIDELTERLLDHEELSRENQEEINQYIATIHEYEDTIKQLEEKIITVRDEALDEQRAHVEELELQTKDTEKALADERTFSQELLDKQLKQQTEVMELKSRMREYEQGTYGIADAVKEIKEWKSRVAFRDKDISRLTAKLNDTVKKVQVLHEQNQAFRLRLGENEEVDIDLGDLRTKKEIELEQAKALNKVYLKELHKLEEERLKLRDELRFQALQRGAQAVKLGLSADSLNLLESYASRLRVAQRGGASADGLSPEEVLRAVPEVLSADGATDPKDANVAELLKENRQLKEMVRIVSQGKTGTTPGLLTQSVALDGGQNVQLMDRLKQTSADLEVEKGKANLLAADLAQARVQVEKLQQERDRTLRHGGGSSGRSSSAYGTPSSARRRGTTRSRRSPAPSTAASPGPAERSAAGAVEGDAKDRSHTPSDVERSVHDYTTDEGGYYSEGVSEGTYNAMITELSQVQAQLIDALEELSTRNEEVATTSDELKKYKDGLERLQDERSVLFRNHLQRVEELETEKTRVESQLERATERREKDRAEIAEYHALQDRLSQSDEGRQIALAEQSREMTLLKTNEVQQARRIDAMEHSIKMLRQENQQLVNDNNSMGKALQARIRQLMVANTEMKNRVESVEEALERSVPANDLELLKVKYENLSKQHAETSNRERDLLSRVTTLNHADVQAKHNMDKVYDLQTELDALKVKSKALKSAADAALKTRTKSRKGKADGDAADGEDDPEVREAKLYMKISKLESEFQAAVQGEKAAREKFEMRREDYDRMAAQVLALEAAYEEAKNGDKEKDSTIAELRERVQGCVGLHEYNSKLDMIQELEKQLNASESDVEKYKGLADIATRQTEQVQAQNDAIVMEVGSLQDAVRQLSTENEEKEIMGKLHVEIVNLRVSEATAQRKAKSTQAQLVQARTDLAKMELRLSSTEQKLFSLREEVRVKVNEQSRKTDVLRMQLNAAIPMEKATLITAQLQDALRHNSKIQARLHSVQRTSLKEIKEAKDERDAALEEADTAQAELRIANSELKVIKESESSDRPAIKKATEWGQKVLAAQLSEKKSARRLRSLEERENTLVRTIESLEAEIDELDSRLMREHAQQEEIVEMLTAENEDLESKLNDAQKNKWTMMALSDDAHAPVGPVVKRLEQKFKQKLVENKDSTVKYMQQIAELNSQLGKLKHTVQLKENDIAERDIIITELRDRRSDEPGTAGDRASEVEAAGRVRKVAEQTMSTLQTLLAQKNTLIVKYQDMLKTQREDFEAQRVNDQAEIRRLSDLLYKDGDSALQAFKKSADRARDPPQVPVPTIAGREVEDILLEKDHKIARANELLAQKKIENASLQEEFKRLHVQLDELKEELVEAKKVEPPSKALERLVKDLKSQLSKKEKQQSTLKSAIAKLKEEMLDTADSRAREDLTAQNHALTADDKLNRQVEKRTAALQKRVDVLVKRAKKAKDEVETMKEKESKLLKAVVTARADAETSAERVESMQGDMKSLAKTVKELQRRERTLKQELELLNAGYDPSRESEVVEQLRARIRVLESHRGHGATSDLDREMEALSSPRRTRTHDGEHSPPTRGPRDDKESGGSSSSDSDDGESKKKTVSKTKKTGKGKGKGKGKKLSGTSTLRKSKTSTAAPINWQEIERRLKRRVDTLTKELEGKSKLLDQVERRWKDRIATLEKDNASLKTKVDQAARSRGPAAQVDLSKLGTIEDLKNQIFALETEKDQLEKLAKVELPQRTLELESENQKLRDDLSRSRRETLRARNGVEADPTEVNEELEHLRAREQELLDELLLRNSELLEHKIASAQSKAQVTRLEKRLADLTLIKDLKGTSGAKKTTKKGSLVKSKTGTTDSGAQSRKVAELETLVQSLTGPGGVVESLRLEIHQLQRKAHSNTKYMELLGKCRAMKKAKLAVEAELEELKSKGTASAQDEKRIKRLTTMTDQLRAQVKKEQDSSAKLRSELNKARSMTDFLKDDVKRLESSLASRERSSRDNKSRSRDNDKGEIKDLRTDVRELEADLQDKDKALLALRDDLASLQEENVELQRACDYYEAEIEMLQKERGDGDGDGDGDDKRGGGFGVERGTKYLRDQIQVLKAHVHSLQEERDLMLSPMPDSAQTYDDPRMKPVIVKKARAYDKIVRQRDALIEECALLKNELSAFDEEFFDELEDLKYNFQKAVNLNAELETKLERAAKKHGFPHTRSTDAAIGGRAVGERRYRRNNRKSSDNYPRLSNENLRSSVTKALSRIAHPNL